MSENNRQTQRRIIFISCIAIGISSSIITFYLSSFSLESLIATVTPQAIVLVILSKYYFNKYSTKLSTYVFVISASVWFILGTILIQLTG